MNPEVIQFAHNKINDDAERLKSRVNYICTVIEADEPRMREVFLTDDESLQDGYSVDTLLFERVSLCIDTMLSDYVRSYGAATGETSMGEPPFVPSVALGWEELRKPTLVDENIVSPKNAYSELKYITPAGLTVIDGLQAAQGLDSPTKQRQTNKARRDDIWRK